jgi:hypothetical protein
MSKVEKLKKIKRYSDLFRLLSMARQIRSSRAHPLAQPLAR